MFTQKNCKNIHRHLFVIALNWKQPKCPSRGEQINRIVVHAYDKISLCNKDKWTVDAHSNMDKSQNNYADLKNQTKKIHRVWSRLHKLLKNTSKSTMTAWKWGCLGMGKIVARRGKKGFTKEHEEIFVDGYIHNIDWAYCFISFIKLYNLNLCSLISVNYTSIMPTTTQLARGFGLRTKCDNMQRN